MHFIDALKQPVFLQNTSAPAGQFTRYGLSLPDAIIPETARASLIRVLKGRRIPVTSGGIPLIINNDIAFTQEEFKLEILEKSVLITAAEPEGVRGAVYLFEEQLRIHESTAVLTGEFHRTPAIRWRVSRCFFTPTCRPPFYKDELTDDIDYYPDPYLDRLAHERVNGLWITVYLRDMPTTVFPTHGKDADKRLSKLKRIVERCARYGIKCFLYMSEPKGFGDTDYQAFPRSEAFPDIIGHHTGNFDYFCTSSEVGQRYLRETLEYIFKNVPGLGGVINIMSLESSLPCATAHVYEHLGSGCNCPRCSKRSPEELYRELVELMSGAIRKHQPDAEFVGWFYVAWYIKGDPEEHHFRRIADNWPDDSCLMFNYETGGESFQQGKNRPVLDYSLSFIGPSELWFDIARRVQQPAAKLQVACSHEDASVPIIPVPGNLYDKYKTLQEYRTRFTMMCWYFGNYPGLMNRAAGRLSFSPFPASEIEFLRELARLDWMEDTDTVAQAWQFFGQGYREFPENINFKWFGPLHHGITFPWYLFPTDTSMPESYIFGSISVGGDHIGECSDFWHTPREIISQLRMMDRFWSRGWKLLSKLGEKYISNPERMNDLYVAEAIGLQIKSALNLYIFYDLRERMIFERCDLREKMIPLVKDEIDNTLRMRELCEKDSRLGYHSECCGYHFWPEKLTARFTLLKQLLENDFPRFNHDLPEVRAYAGDSPGTNFLLATHGFDNAPFTALGQAGFRFYFDNSTLFLEIKNVDTNTVIVDLEPYRTGATFTMSEKRIADIPPYWDVEHIGSDLLFKVDLSFLAGFRINSQTPMRFNLSIGDHSFKVRHPLPDRLMVSNVNPKDLTFLRFEK